MGWHGTWTRRLRRPSTPARLAKPSGVCQLPHIRSAHIESNTTPSTLSSCPSQLSFTCIAGAGCLYVCAMDGLPAGRSSCFFYYQPGLEILLPSNGISSISFLLSVSAPLPISDPKP